MDDDVPPDLHMIFPLCDLAKCADGVICEPHFLIPVLPLDLMCMEALTAGFSTAQPLAPSVEMQHLPMGSVSVAATSHISHRDKMDEYYSAGKP